MTDVDNALGFALGVMFVNETFDEKTKPEAEKMIRLVTKAFRWNSVQITFLLQKTAFSVVKSRLALGSPSCLSFCPASSRHWVLSYICFRNGLEEADWMDNATRRKAEEKVNHLVVPPAIRIFKIKLLFVCLSRRIRSPT